MAEELPSLHVDTDWKKQAQEEKRRLAEQEQQRQQKEKEQRERDAAAPPAAGPGGAATGPGGRGARGGRGQREMPPASFATLVQSVVTQALLYLGELAVPGSEPMLNLDMARRHLDTLAVLEEKTANNLTEDEQRVLDTALYETRMRYVNVATQFI